MLLYPSLKKLLLSMALSLLGSVIPKAGGLLTLAGFIVLIVALREMRALGQGMQKAYRTLLISIWLMLGSIFVCAVGAVLPVVGLIVVLIGVLMLLAGCAYSVYSDYCLYGALDEQVASRPYDYPAGRIMWGFRLSVLSILFSLVVSAVVSLLNQLPLGGVALPVAVQYLLNGLNLLVLLLQLGLVFEFSRAVRRDEGL